MTAVARLAEPPVDSHSRAARLLGQFPSFWLLQLLGWSAYGVGSFVALNMILSAVVPPAVLFGAEALRSSLGLGLSLALRPVYRLLWRRGVALWILAAVSVAASVACGTLLLFGFKVALLPRVLPELARMAPASYAKTALDYSIVFVAWSALYFAINYWRDLQRERERTVESRAETRLTQLRMLRYQLNPHFLFNSLTSLHALIREDPSRAEAMVEELSDFLRYALVHDDMKRVPLVEELEVARSYLAIEQLRFEHRLDVQFDVEPAAERFVVPPFLLHPLVENAIKHGMDGARPLRIRIAARHDHGTLRLTVGNSGRWKPSGSTTSIGLTNVRRRLDFSYGSRGRCEIGGQPGWVEAIVSIDQPEHAL